MKLKITNKLKIIYIYIYSKYTYIIFMYINKYALKIYIKYI